ncbi:MAG: hypothetical protein GTO67_00515 [Gammaproteobacteria bacterium]|nr:hypothetical protein [Gammaproteobacteria bacterium]NIN37248.1 hypothetical protein [Gammaproteobacteria bacterium]NIO26106.1 hypothetical protein [Gammaproteobacteria bacterium]NIO66719.1 hypothetical protein [Gammaproteobacteria bacterium]NIP46392.1 hypothetical protein [Gammaproteobacteria bacterium]
MNPGRASRDAGPAPVFCTRALDLARILPALDEIGAVAVPVLDDGYRRSLVEAAKACRFRPARPLVGRGEHRVRQRMEVSDDFPAESAFRGLTDAFQRLWDEGLAGTHERPFEGRLVFNDLMLQRYTVGEVGITPHRDRTGYRNLVCLFILEGVGRFYVCENRAGRGAREIPHVAGDVLLMRAPGFRGSSERPFHFVRDIRSPRYIFGLRQERL